jgi:glucokinase
MFISIIAGEASNRALKVLATGSVYIAGGGVQHMLAALEKPAFVAVFQTQGTLRRTDRGRLPIHAIVSEAGLNGRGGLRTPPEL